MKMRTVNFVLKGVAQVILGLFVVSGMVLIIAVNVMM